jgi:hypothetical protein
VISADDSGAALAFEVTPVSLYAWPPETQVGLAVRVTRPVPVIDFPRGTGGPGGVGLADGTGNVRAWLRADEGVVVSGKEVTSWEDQSGYERDALAIEPERRPELVNGVGPRRASALRFDGARHLALPRPVEDDFSLMAVFATTSSTSSGSWWLAPTMLGGDTPPPCSMEYQLGINGGRPLFVVANVPLNGTGNYNDGAPHVFVAARFQSAFKTRMYVDGVERGNANTRNDSLTCPPELFVGSSNATDGFWTGDLFEACAFSFTLSKLERDLVDNYVAARFGTTPATPLYRAAATHGGDVAGIGRESGTSFIERAEGPGILEVSNPSALSDGDYLLWGTDRPLDFSLSADVPRPHPRRLERTWAFTLTDGGRGDGVGRVTLRFRVGGLALSDQVEDFALLFDDDGAFFDARVHAGSARYDRALQAIEFPEVELGPERFFALAVTPQ